MSASLEDVADKKFDYVIIGGGTAGLVLAARLTEDPNVTVAVLEAGQERLGDPLIDVPAQFGKQFGNPLYAYDFVTVPQAHSNNVSCFWPRGKVLGGSSAINFFCWTKPPATDIDAWEKLGNPGWNWARFNEYSRKGEGFVPPDKATAERYGQTYNITAHGSSGPLKTSFPQLTTGLEVPFQQSLLNAGITLAKDYLNGNPVGTFMGPGTVNPGTQTRSYAATAYYQPIAHRPNLRVLCGALVFRIIADEGERSGGRSVRATGVEFEYESNKYPVLIGREVILCAGALQSPQVLELSGIGRRDVLGPLSIKTILELPGVGINMQEHMNVATVYEVDPNRNFETLDLLHDEDYLKKQQELYKSQKGVFTLGITGYSFLPLSTVAPTDIAKEIIRHQQQAIEVRKNRGRFPAGIEEQYKILLDSYQHGIGGECEIVLFPGWFGKGVPEPGKKYISIITSFNRPFSRGVIHAKSQDPHDLPIIDPRYFEEPLDLEAMRESVKFIRRITQLEPFKDAVVREVAPGASISSDAEVEEYIKDNVGTTFHTTSTLSMLPHEADGVVDPKLRVYGTENIRVADLSIVPLHVACHTQSIAYAIGEIAADIILGKLVD